MSAAPAARLDWERALRESGVGLGPAMAGLALATYADADGAGICPSLRALAEGLGVDRKSFGRWVGELTETGWLEVVAVRPKRQREYQLAIPYVDRVCSECGRPTDIPDASPHLADLRTDTRTCTTCGAPMRDHWDEGREQCRACWSRA